MKVIAGFTVNGHAHELAIEPHWLLIEVLREALGFTGTKHSCGVGNCGACTVLVDGEPVLACMTLAMAARGRSIVTIEGLADGPDLHPLQQTFIDYGAIQCGYCTPGMILAAKALLDRELRPHRGRRAPRTLGQHLPLHRLRQDRRGGAGRGSRAARRDATAAGDRRPARLGSRDRRGNDRARRDNGPRHRRRPRR